MVQNKEWSVPHLQGLSLGNRVEDAFRAIPPYRGGRRKLTIYPPTRGWELIQEHSLSSVSSLPHTARETSMGARDWELQVNIAGVGNHVWTIHRPVCVCVCGGVCVYTHTRTHTPHIDVYMPGDTGMTLIASVTLPSFSPSSSQYYPCLFCLFSICGWVVTSTRNTHRSSMAGGDIFS